jgi:ParB/RepB/Spo0J family partition protein
MSDVAIPIEAGMPAAIFPLPDHTGHYNESDCEAIISPFAGCYLWVIQIAEGWKANTEATLPDGGTFGARVGVDHPSYPSRGEAIVDACEALVLWLSGEKEIGSKKRRQCAAKLQEWALEIEKREAPTAAIQRVTAARGPDLQTFAKSSTTLLAYSIAVAPPQMISIELIDECEWNPRKSFSEKKLEALAASMRESGWWPWLAGVARPRPNGRYELAAGHRRLRSAKRAGLTEAPLVIIDLDDERFLKVLTFDNSNREDPHALDEADGFRFYMQRTGCTVEVIAAEIGQAPTYVYQRLQYSALIPEVRAAFADDEITAGHASQIARLPVVADQKRALGACKDHWGALRPVRDLTEWIAREIHRDVRKACFDWKSSDLLPGVSSCQECPKRVGNCPELFTDIKHKETCTDPVCFRRKEQAFIDIAIARRNQDSDPSKPPLLRISSSWRAEEKGVLDTSSYHKVTGKEHRCDSTRDAIVTEGEGLGKTIQVCADKACKKHHGKISRRNPEELSAERERQEKARLEEAVDDGVRGAIAAKASSPFGRRELWLLARSLYTTTWHDMQVKICRAWKIEPGTRKIYGNQTTKDYETPVLDFMEALDDRKLVEVTIELALRRLRSGGEGDALGKIGLEFNVDAKAVEKAIRAEYAAKKSKAKPSAKNDAKSPTAPAKKRSSKRSTAKKSPAKRTPAKKACAKKSSAKKASGKRKGAKA